MLPFLHLLKCLIAMVAGSVTPAGPGTLGATTSGAASSASNGRKRWTGMLSRRMRSALCEMWRPNQHGQEDPEMQE